MPTPPPGGYQEGGWYEGRQYIGGSFSDPGQIHSQSSQVGAGQLVSKEVNLQSDQAQGLAPGSIETYLQQQRKLPAPANVAPGGSGSLGAPGGAGVPGGGSGAGAGVQAPATLDLPGLYQSLQADSGVSELESKYSQMEKDFIGAKGELNDNPWISEATRVGREAKIIKLFDERTANIRGEIATKKADIETQLNLQMKQFDINSQASQQAFQQFNSLLAMGALDNANGEDIANITRSTGISSDMIYSAIGANKKKNVSTTLYKSEADDGTVTVSVINEQTGEIVKQTNLGQIGNKQGTSGGGTATERKDVQLQSIRTDLTGEIRNGVGLLDILRMSKNYLDPQEVYETYNLNSPHGPAYESAKELSAYGIKK